MEKRDKKRSSRLIRVVASGHGYFHKFFLGLGTVWMFIDKMR